MRRSRHEGAKCIHRGAGEQRDQRRAEDDITQEQAATFAETASALKDGPRSLYLAYVILVTMALAPSGLVPATGEALAELEGERPYLVVELLGRGTLAERLDERGSLSLEETLAIGLALTRALRHAHGRGVVHRDLKPDNVLFRADRSPVLVDFGIAVSLSPDTLRLTGSGELLGTPHYMAPELLTEVDHPEFVQQDRHNDVAWHSRYGFGVDVYAFGVLMWELGNPHHLAPWAGKGMMAVSRLLDQGKRPDMAGAAEGLAGAFATWAWAQEPAQRPTAASVLSEQDRPSNLILDLLDLNAVLSLAGACGSLAYRLRHPVRLGHPSYLVFR